MTLYLLTYAGTLIWAVGSDGWAQVPRLVGPTVLSILVLLTIPILRRHQHRERATGETLADARQAAVA